MKTHSIFTLLLLLLLMSCTFQKEHSKYTNSTLASAHPLATEAGNQMYQKGGNAFDAAVAAGFALAVVEPSMSGLGGRLQAIFQTADLTIGGVDASTEIPKNYVPLDTKHPYGYPTIGIPGVVAGLVKLQKEHGKLKLATVIQPAINYAKEGFKLLPGEARRHQSAKELLTEFKGSRFHFLKTDSTTYQTGEKWIQRDLASVLEQIAQKGAAGFYEGTVAQTIVEDVQKNGGILTLEDLKNYKALDARILNGKFRGTKIHALYLPSFGAITIQILQILDQISPSISEEEWAMSVGKATEIAYQYRKYQSDSLTQILSYKNAEKIAQSFKTDYQKVASIETAKLPASWTAEMGHTSHLTAADAEGNVVSLTQTIGPNMGSKVATQGLGFLYAVTMGGYLGNYQPGDRAQSHITPTLFSEKGQVILALGAAGGNRIVTAVTQVADRYFSQKHTLEKSVFLPRVYPFQDSLWLENHEGIRDLNAEINTKIQPVKMINQKARFGRVHAVALDATANQWIGVADPDWEGTVSHWKIKN
ncbi:MAG: gamma-glutamyltransferase [Flavobacteriaceae bacterium]